MATVKIVVCLAKKEISAAVKKLRGLRRKVSARQWRKMNLDIRELERAEKTLRKFMTGVHGRIYKIPE